MVVLKMRSENGVCIAPKGSIIPAQQLPATASHALFIIWLPQDSSEQPISTTSAPSRKRSANRHSRNRSNEAERASLRAHENARDSRRNN